METIHGGDIYSHYEIKYGDKLIDFSANLNPLGMPDEVKRAIEENTENYSAYPDVRYRRLKEHIARYEGVLPEHIFVSNGAAEAIYRTAAAVRPKKALVCAPAFAEYEQALCLCGCNTKKYTLKEEYGFEVRSDILKHITEDTDMVFICNPNNPTGKLVEKNISREITEKCLQTGAIAVFDECFLEFANDAQQYGVKDMLGGYKNLVILKAFTKMYAMAGIRLGYTLCSDVSFNEKLEICGPPWNVSSVAEACGIAALESEKRGFCASTREYVAKQSKALCKALTQRGMKVYSPSANYIFFRSEDETLYEKFLEYGILLRSCANYEGLDKHFYRIAVRSEEENLYFIEILEKITGQTP